MTFVFTEKHVLTYYASYSSKICVSAFPKTNVSDSGLWSIVFCATWCNLPVPLSCGSLVAFKPLSKGVISDPRRGCYIVLPVFIFLSFFLFFFFLFFFFFFLPLLSRPYLWNRYSQRLQIECAAWSCCLILHYSLPSNSLRYFFIYFFFCQDFVRAISLEPLLAETPN